MKAAYYETTGPTAGALVLTNVSDPEPGPDEVRVRIYSSGVNPSDIKTRTAFSGSPSPFPRIIPHQDGSGVIDRVGANVDQARIGQRVWIYEAQLGRPHGTAAEFCVVPSQNAVPLPDEVSFEIGASLGVPALTAHRCLFADGDIRGKRILIQGGAGAVGTAAIILAKWAGAWVATTVSKSEQENLVRDLGADLIINRKTHDVASEVLTATDNKGVDIIVEVDLVENRSVDMKVLATNGTVNAYATHDPKSVLALPFLDALVRGFVFRFVYVYRMPDEAKRKAIASIGECLARGAYRPAIGLIVPLDEIERAHAAQQSGQITGKIILKI